jgi:exodeoxyribonuclease-3
MTLKLISWNVNGIRAVMQKGFLEFIKTHNPDIFCLQETKAHPSQVEHELKELGYHYEYWNSAEKKGYSGTAIFSKLKPLNVTYGLNIKEHDTEGRVITAEFEQFFVITVYTPNSQHELARLPYRREWNNAFLNHIIDCDSKKPILFCGDLNVAHQEIDLKNPKANRKNAGFSDEEREDFTKLLESGFIDSFRYLYPEKIEYTWWSYMFNARAKNIGWRIDYWCVSNRVKDQIKDAKILSSVEGSDHCPVELDIY